MRKAKAQLDALGYGCMGCSATPTNRSATGLSGSILVSWQKHLTLFPSGATFASGDPSLQVGAGTDWFAFQLRFPKIFIQIVGVYISQHPSGGLPTTWSKHNSGLTLVTGDFNMAPQQFEEGPFWHQWQAIGFGLQIPTTSATCNSGRMRDYALLRHPLQCIVSGPFIAMDSKGSQRP